MFSATRWPLLAEGEPIFYLPTTHEAETLPNLVLVEQAAKESEYHPDHIRYLAREKLITGEKHGGVWLIDLDSLKAYEAQMQEQGSQRHTPAKYRK